MPNVLSTCEGSPYMESFMVYGDYRGWDQIDFNFYFHFSLGFGNLTSINFTFLPLSKVPRTDVLYVPIHSCHSMIDSIPLSLNPLSYLSRHQLPAIAPRPVSMPHISKHWH